MHGNGPRLVQVPVVAVVLQHHPAQFGVLLITYPLGRQRGEFVEEGTGDRHPAPCVQLEAVRVTQRRAVPRSRRPAACDCHIGYVHLETLPLYDVFAGGVLERVPRALPDRVLLPVLPATGSL